MSAVFADEAENTAEQLRRAGATGRTILAALPRDRVRTPAKNVDDRFPKPEERMPTIDAYELGVEKLKDAFEREKEEELRRAWERRLLFDPRPLGGEPGRFLPRPAALPESRFANGRGGRKGRAPV
jgi:hypothetical protein